MAETSKEKGGEENGKEPTKEEPHRYTVMLRDHTEIKTKIQCFEELEDAGCRVCELMRTRTR